MSKNNEIELFNTKMGVIEKILNDTAMNIKGLSVQVGNLSQQIADNKSDIRNLSNEVEILKYNERITSGQADTIRRAAKRRVAEIIGDPADYPKYYHLFIGRLYSNMRKYNSLGGCIDETHAGDFQRVLNGIESWEPSEGCVNLKLEADAKAKARREAKRLGYI